MSTFMFRQQLSSSSPASLFAIIIGTLGFLAVAFIVIAITQFDESPLLSVVLFLTAIAGMGLVLWQAPKTCIAEIDSESFIVTTINPLNKKTVTINFTEIEEVQESMFAAFHPSAVLKLARPCDLGVKIRILTEYYGDEETRPNPFVEELNEIIARAKGLHKKDDSVLF